MSILYQYKYTSQDQYVPDIWYYYNMSPLNLSKLIDIHFILEYEKTVGVTQVIYSH